MNPLNLPSKKAISRPIISLKEGKEIGHVRGLLVDPNQLAVVALVVGRKGFLRSNLVLSHASIKSIGDQVVTADGASLEKVTPQHPLAPLLKDPVILIGSRVITEAGIQLGLVREFYWDQVTGKIIQLEIVPVKWGSLAGGKMLLPADLLVTVGPRLLIARAGAEKELIPAPNFLARSWESLRQAGSKISSSVAQSTKELGKRLSQPLEDEGANGKSQGKSADSVSGPGLS
ncbi:MAG: PRC-barrel domain-containing protein [Clostridia bacterium]|nr:PRC-barrel domain-containing protein [Clostridia bacterium]